MKYLIKNNKVECSGNKHQLIQYIKEKYPNEYWVKEYGRIFETDFGKFKFAIETLGLQLSNKMSNAEYNKIRRR